MPKNAKQYDASYKKLFTNQEITASLLQGFVPEEILAEMDLSTLEPMPSEHITRGNRERRNDLLWKARYGNAWCYLLIMLEFQSVEDWWMSVRISAYSALLLQDIIKYDKLNKKDKLPLIFPFVIYNGDKKWHAPEEINQLLFEHDNKIDIYQPHQKYYLLDIKHLSTLIENADSNLSMQIFNLENSASIENIIAVLDNLAKILPPYEKSHIHEAFINLLSVNIIDDPDMSEQLNHCKTVQEAYSMLAESAPRWKISLLEEGFEKGKMEGRAEGKEEGVLIGIKNALQTILASRFGLPSKELLTAIDKITSVNALQSLLIEATSAESMNKFIEMVHNRHD